MAIAILRRRLFGTRLVFSRTVLYGLLAVVVVAAHAGRTGSSLTRARILAAGRAAAFVADPAGV